jgi:ATP-dependent Clp protease protease subunit
MVDKTAAIIAKLQAETAEIESRMEREGEAYALSLRLQENELEVSGIALKKARRDEATLLSDWRFDHTLHFVGHVAKDTVQATIDKLHMWSRIDPGCAITIVFNSPGGSVIDGLALFDYIRFLQAQGHHITTVALGYAASMGGILLQAGDVRAMARGSWLGIHEVAFNAQGKIGEVEDMYEFGKRLKEQAANIFVDRSGGKLTREALEHGWLRKDWWLSAEEALDLGLIDEIR